MSSRFPEQPGTRDVERAVTPHGTPSPRTERLALLVPVLMLAAVAGSRALGNGIAFAQTAQHAAAPAARQAATLDTTRGMPGDEARVPGMTWPKPAIAESRPWATHVLRACADPNNLPFSSAKEPGLENRLAELLAAELGARVEYTWWAERRGFFRRTVGAGRCDVVLGVPAGFDMLLTTRPYYRSSYVFVSRRDGGPDVRSFDDPVLRTARVGVQLVGDDYVNTPPAHALARRGIVRNVTGFSLYGDYATPDPPARILDAVAEGRVDVAVVWGPLAGWYARRSPTALRLTPVSPAIDPPGLPFAFDIAVGVRHGDRALRDTLDTILVRRRADVARLLDRYGVPRVPGPSVAATATMPAARGPGN